MHFLSHENDRVVALNGSNDSHRQERLKGLIELYAWACVCWGWYEKTIYLHLAMRRGEKLFSHINGSPPLAVLPFPLSSHGWIDRPLRVGVSCLVWLRREYVVHTHMQKQKEKNWYDIKWNEEAIRTAHSHPRKKRKKKGLNVSISKERDIVSCQREGGREERRRNFT